MTNDKQWVELFLLKENLFSMLLNKKSYEGLQQVHNKLKTGKTSWNKQ